MVSSARARLGAIVERLNKFESTAENIFDGILGVCVAFAAGLVVVWVFVFVASVIARDFFYVSTPYLEEYTGYWTLAITCLALAYTFRKDGHIRVDTVVKYLPQRARDIMNIFVALIAMIASCIFTFYGLRVVVFAFRIGAHSVYGTTLMWPVYLWEPIGYGLLSLALFFYLWRSVLVLVGSRRISG